MRGRATRSAIAASSAVLAVLGIAGCNQSKPNENSSQSDLKIVEQVQIDQNGAEVKPGGHHPADPAGDGKGRLPAGLDRDGRRPQRPRRRARHQHQERRAARRRQAQRAANPGCQVQLKTFDTEGDPQKATAIAPQIVDDAFTIGLVGPAFSGETKATGSVFDQAGLVAATASATNVTLSEQGWKTFFRGLANDGVQGPSVANYLKNTIGDKKVRRRRQHRLRHRPGAGRSRDAGPGGRRTATSRSRRATRTSPPR